MCVLCAHIFTHVPIGLIVVAVFIDFIFRIL